MEDTAEVSGVPQDVAPHGGFQAVVEGERTFLLDDLGDAVHGAGVAGCGGLVLQTDLDELEWHDDDGLGGTSGGSGENRQ